MAGTTEITYVYKVAPSHEFVHLAYLYTRFKKKIVKWLAEKKPSGDDREIIEIIHRNWFNKVRQLPLSLVFDLYKDALNVYKSFSNLPRKKREYPRVKRVSVLLSFVEIKGGKAKILKEEIPLFGKVREDLQIANARLVKREDGWFLHVTYLKEVREVNSDEAVAVDVNEDFIVVGNPKMIVEIPTRVSDAFHYLLLAELLKQKYKWRNIKRVNCRIRHFLDKARRILTDSAKKISKWVIDIARMLNAGIVILENLKGLFDRVMKKMRTWRYRVRLVLMQFYRLQQWIKWQARKHGMRVVSISSFKTSSRCPKCGGKMIETSYRTYYCFKCDYEENRDYIAVLNLYGRVKGNPRLPTQ